MRVVAALCFAVAMSSAVFAQEGVPDLKGEWTSEFDFVIYGSNTHHPGGQGAGDPPRFGPIAFTVAVEGQDGRKAWGQSWSDPAKKEPFAWVIAADNRTIIGADTDGVHNMTLLGPDSIQMCYAHAGTSPSGSIVAACGILERRN
jgi:hypothetical protein